MKILGDGANGSTIAELTQEEMVWLFPTDDPPQNGDDRNILAKENFERIMKIAQDVKSLLEDLEGQQYVVQ